MTTLTIKPDTIKVGPRLFPFTTYAEASAAYRAAIKATGATVSGETGPKAPTPLLLAAGTVVAYISQDGRVWAGDPKSWKSGQSPIFNPYA